MLKGVKHEGVFTSPLESPKVDLDALCHLEHPQHTYYEVLLGNEPQLVQPVPEEDSRRICSVQDENKPHFLSTLLGITQHFRTWIVGRDPKQGLEQNRKRTEGNCLATGRSCVCIKSAAHEIHLSYPE